MVTAEQIKKLPKGDFRVETPNAKQPGKKILRQVQPQFRQPQTISATLAEIMEEYLRIESKQSKLPYTRRECLIFKVQVLKKLSLNREYYFGHIFPQDPSGEFTRILRNGKTEHGKVTSTSN